MIVAVSSEHPVELSELLAAEVPRGWSLDVIRAGEHAVAIAGAEYGVAGRWLVAGRPSAHPWGVPGHAILPGRMAEVFDRNGVAALHFGAGPFVAVDLEHGALLAALNGIVPVWRTDGDRWVAATRERIVAQVPGGRTTRVTPGSVAYPTGDAPVSALHVREAVPGLTTRAVDRERRRITMCEPSWALDDLVWDVDLSAGPLRSLWEDDLPTRWWEARLEGRWLHAPAFERPALDLLMLSRDAR